MPAPDDPKRRALLVKTTARPDSIFPRGGAVWNFPAGQSGFVEARVRLKRGFGGARIALLDRWVNPTDPTVPDLAMGQLEITPGGDLSGGGQMSAETWHTLRLTWHGDAAGAPCEITLDGQVAGSAAFSRPAHHGISYIHFQSTGSAPDEGLIIGAVEAVVQP